MVLYAEVGNSLLQSLANGLQRNIVHSEIHCIMRINLVLAINQLNAQNLLL